MANPKIEDGYIKVYRKVIESQVFQNEGLFKVFMWCLLKANHKGQWVQVKTGKGTTEVWVEPGQFIFGRFKAAKKLKMNPETVRKRMMKLKTMQNLTMSSTRQYSLVTIVNWEFYQGHDEKVPCEVPSKYHPSTTNKNVKNKESIGHFDLEGFDAFWKVYPRKVKKKESLKVWEKLKPDEQLTQIIIAAVEKQKTSEWKDRDKKHIPHPSTWLNGERWNDEIEQPQRWDEKTY